MEFTVTEIRPVIMKLGERKAQAELDHTRKVVSYEEFIDNYDGVLDYFEKRVREGLLAKKGAVAVLIALEAAYIFENMGESSAS